MRRIVVILADTHAGHKLSLMPKEVKLLDIDERGKPKTWTPRQTATQRWLDKCYTKDMESVKQLAGESEIVVVHAGDITWGRTYPDNLVSGKEMDQYKIAEANMRPWLELDNVKVMRLIHGTASHEFGHGTANEVVASQLQAEYSEKSILAIRHLVFTVEGVSFDVSHHRPSKGIRVWTSGNQLRYYLRSLMLKEILSGHTPPRAVIGAHFHTYKHEMVEVEEGGQLWKSDIYLCPAYCGMNHYAQRVTQSEFLLTCGLLAFVVEGGEIAFMKAFKRTVDLRTKETL